MGCGAKYATGVTTASIWRFWNLCVKGTAEAMDKVEKMLMSCCKFCIYTHPVNSKFTTWHWTAFQLRIQKFFKWWGGGGLRWKFSNNFLFIHVIKMHKHNNQTNTCYVTVSVFFLSFSSVLVLFNCFFLFFKI